ncbi:MAG: LacI family DNA-binding transcriptional regulator [Paenibacillaceae bacterium]|nr:LacI family DNA-binding transcriptional regulator [Paenibacillaceae bacterium]
MANSRDVAKLAGVSISSVSRAFREDTYISKEVKQRILSAADELGYTPNLLARSLKNQKSHIIGLIISDIDNPFYSIMTRIIEAELKRSGYRILLSYSNENSEREAEDLSLLSSSRVDGILFTPTSVKNRSLVNQLKKQNIALVQMYRRGYTDLDSILVDDQRGAYLATKHLLQNGHRDILLLSVESSISPNRAEGYRQAMREENIPIQDHLIMHLPFQTDLRMTIYNKIKETQPSALIAGTNTIGMDFIKVCKEHKLSIPDDISLIMFDDVAWAGLLDITTISQPIDYLGLSACRAIIDRIEKNKSGEPIVSVLEPFLIARNSVKNLYLR